MQTENKCKCCELTICDIVDRLVPAGTIIYHAGEVAPKGYLVCDGSQVSREDYKNLFGAINTIYGAGDGAATFNLPDLRGEFIRCLDNGKGVDAGRQLASYQGDAIRNITGELLSRYGCFHPTQNGVLKAEHTGNYEAQLHAVDAYHNFTTVSIDASRIVPTANENRPRNIALLACIKY